MAIADAKQIYYTYVWCQDETNASYLSECKNIIEVTQHYGGSVGDDEVFINNKLKKKGIDYRNVEAKDIAKQTAEQAKNKAQGTVSQTRVDTDCS